MSAPAQLYTSKFFISAPGAAPMPEFEKMKIANLQCPPPLQPSQIQPIISAINNRIKVQQNRLNDLNTYITDLEKRYMIQFNVNSVNYYTASASNTMPQLNITGNIPNPQLNFSIYPAPKGDSGFQGPAGPIGPPGVSGNLGNNGPSGYWGARGSLL